MTRRQIISALRSSLDGLYDPRERDAVVDRLCGDKYGFDRFGALLEPDREVEGIDEAAFRDDCRRLSEGCPVQYVTGRAEFCGMNFMVGPAVLVPRAETEQLVRLAAADLTALRSPRVLDVGTGSGAIAVALSLTAHAQVTAVDVSADALAFAARNALLNHAEVDFVKADIFSWEPPEAIFDMVISNPPYIPLSERALLHRNVRDYEPGEALFVPDDDPLKFYRRIGRVAREALKSGGVLWFEAHERYAAAVAELLVAEGFEGTQVIDDSFGKPRFVRCRRS